MTLSRIERAAWALAFALLVVFAVPWFLWGQDGIVVGLPVWLWWHVGWMALAALVFGLFAQRAWGLGTEELSDA